MMGNLLLGGFSKMGTALITPQYPSDDYGKLNTIFTDQSKVG